MRTNIVIDDELMKEAFSVSRATTKKDLIHEALREMIRLKKRKDLTSCPVVFLFIRGLRHKELRKTRR